jgi:taurine dioxygenase
MARDVVESDLSVRPLSWRTGAEVIGLDLADAATIDDGVFEWLRQLVGERCVLLFRGQSLTHEQHLAFTRRFGPLAETGGISRYSVTGYPDIFAVSNKKVDGVRPETAETARQWHSDQSFLRAPAMGSLLYCVETPRYGGDTMFANMYQAYEGLSEGMRSMLSGQRLYHNAFNSRNKAVAKRAPYSEAEKAALQGAFHPVVVVHPVTGKPALYCSDMLTDQFEGWTIEESKPVLDFLHAHSTQPAFTYRHVWEPGDLLFWDNRCTNHYAPPDYDTDNMDEPENYRLLYRTTLAGGPLVGVAAAGKEPL